MDYHALPRRQLQILCKEHGIPANATNLEMADALSVMLKPKPDITKQPDKRTTRQREPAVSSSESKVKDLKSSDTQVQNALGSGEKSSTKPQRATRRRDCATEAPTPTTSKAENSDEGQSKVTSAVKMQEAKTVSTRRRAGKRGDDELQSKPAEVASTKVESPKLERKKDRAGGIVLRRGRVKVRSPLASSKTPESGKGLGESDVRAESSKAVEGETMMPHTQSCVVATQKILPRKNTRFVTFSEVLEVTHTFAEGPSAKVPMHADERVQGRTGSRRAARKDCLQEKTNPQITPQKSQKAPSIDVSKGNNVLSVSKQNNGAFSMSEAENSLSVEKEKTASMESCKESRSRRCRKASNDAIESLNEKEKVSDNCNSVSNTRRSRRLTLVSSDIKLLQDKENGSAVKGEEKVIDSLVYCSTDAPSVSSTRRSRRLTIIPSDVNIDQDKDKLTANSQVKSEGNHEGTTEGAPLAELSRRGRRRTLAPLEINHIQVTGENPGEDMLKSVGKGNDTKSEEYTFELETYIDNQSPKHSEARTSESISVATQEEGNSTTAEAVCNSENVRRGRKNNLTGIVGLSSIGKKNSSKMEKVPDKVARAVRRPDIRKTSKEFRSVAAGPAKSRLNCNDAEAQEEALTADDVEITAAAEDTLDAAEASSLPTGLKEAITHDCRSIQEDMDDLEKAAATKSSNDYENAIVSSKACIEGSIKSLEQVIANEEGADPVNLLSTENISSNKCSGNKLEQNSAEGASIASCDAVHDSNLHALDMGSVSVAVVNNTACDSNEDYSILPVGKESTVKVASAAICLETTTEDPLLANTLSCAQQELVVCTQEGCAASNNSPPAVTKGSISPVATWMGPEENVDEGKQTPSRSLPVIMRMNSDEGYEEGNKHTGGECLGNTSAFSTRLTSDEGIFEINNAVASNPSALTMVRSTEGNLGGTADIKEHAIEMSSNKECSSPASRHMSSDEVTEQDNQYANDIDVEDSLGIEADAVVTEGLQAGGVNSPVDAVETYARMQEVRFDASLLVTNATIDDNIINTKETGNLGGSQFTNDIEDHTIETTISLRSDIDESIEQCCENAGNMDVKNIFGVEVDAVIKEGALPGETCTSHKMCSNIEFLASHENEVVDLLLTEDVEHNPGHDQGADFHLCTEEGATEEQKLNCQDDVVDDIQLTSGEGAPSGAADFEPEIIRLNLPEEGKTTLEEEMNGLVADNLQGISRGDGGSNVVSSTTTDGQVGSLLPLCADVSGNTLPIPVAFKTKKRRTRAIYKSARKAKPSVLQESKSATEIDFGPLMPWDHKEDVEVEGCSTLDMGSDEVNFSSPEESEEGGSEQMGDSFSDGDFRHLTTDVLPLDAYEDVSSYGSSEGSEYDSEEDCSQEEEDPSVEEYSESEEVDTSEEDASETEDESEVGTASFVASRALLSLAKRESSDASSTDRTQVEPNATFKIALLDIESMQPGIQHSSAHESAVSYDEVTELASLSSLFATPPSKVNELVHCLSEPLCTDDALSNEGVSAENGLESMDRGEYHAEFCELMPSLGMDQEENVEVLEDVQRCLEGLSITDEALKEEALALELTFKNDYASKAFRAEVAAATTPDQDTCFYSKAPNEDVEAGKNHPNTCSKSGQDKKVLSESNAQSFYSQITECSTPRSPKDLEVVQYLFAHKSLTAQAEVAPRLEIPITPNAGYVEDEQMIAQEHETRACASDFMDEVEAVRCPEIPQTPSHLIHAQVDLLVLNATQVHSNCLMDEAEAPRCPEEPQTERTDAEAEVMSEQMDQPLENVLNEAQVCANHLFEVTKEPPAALSSTMEIAKEQSLHKIDLTLMSVRKLKLMCKDNDTTKKPITKTPSTRPLNASKPNTSVVRRDIPSANKRSALKALPSNIKSNTPARTPTAKGMQTPRNPMRAGTSNAGENLAPSPRAPASSQRDFGRSVHQ